MSSTNRGRKRELQDLYETPVTAIDSLLSVMNMDQFAYSNFLEPCKASGRIFDRVRTNGTKDFAELSLGVDYLTTEFKDIDFIITNPPFSLALEFLQKSLKESLSVYYLLRLNFLGSQKRKLFWQTNRPSHVLVLSKRPSFTGGETDSTEYAWFCWDTRNAIQLPRGVNVL